MLTRTSVVTRCAAAKKSNPITVSRKNFEQKRTKSLKENFNQLLLIANSDIREYTDFIKELDELHRNEFKGIVDKFKTPKEEDEETEENIFVKKDA